MRNGAPIQVRILPGGNALTAVLRSSHGRVLEIELSDPGAECAPGAATELEVQEALYLGMIDRRQDGRLWVTIEHRLDREPLIALRAMWREGG